MAEAIFMVRRTVGPSGDLNNVREVLINNDDVDTDAQIILNCVAALNTFQTRNIYPDDYFDAVVEISAATAPLNTDQDFLAFGAVVFEFEE